MRVKPACRSKAFGAASLAAAVCLTACQKTESPAVAPATAAANRFIEVDDVGKVPIPFYDPNNFSDPTRIDNPLLPMSPGTQFVLKGENVSDEGAVEHEVVQVVTALTKTVNGLRTVVFWERDISEGEVVEAEIAFFAQDDEGNVWLLGEYPEEYEEGRFQGAPSTWLSGIANARAGIIMPAEPKMTDPVYIQGLAPDVDFQDVARVHKVGQEVCAEAGCYKDVTVIDEWDPLAQPQDGHALKFHAPGAGTVRVEPVGGEEQETLSL
ncbi:MAG: hypothetical protein ACRDKW_10130, partial [Actinomycetota bacterium]